MAFATVFYINRISLSSVGSRSDNTLHGRLFATDNWSELKIDWLLISKKYLNANPQINEPTGIEHIASFYFYFLVLRFLQWPFFWFINFLCILRWKRGVWGNYNCDFRGGKWRNRSFTNATNRFKWKKRLTAEPFHSRQCEASCQWSQPFNTASFIHLLSHSVLSSTCHSVLTLLSSRCCRVRFVELPYYLIQMLGNAVCTTNITLCPI